jgi:hypothetical protein
MEVVAYFARRFVAWRQKVLRNWRWYYVLSVGDKVYINKH